MPVPRGPARAALKQCSGEIVRGPVVGRKNFAGCKSVRGTEVAAVLYTLLESAKQSAWNRATIYVLRRRPR